MRAARTHVDWRFSVSCDLLLCPNSHSICGHSTCMQARPELGRALVWTHMPASCFLAHVHARKSRSSVVPCTGLGVRNCGPSGHSHMNFSLVVYAEPVVNACMQRTYAHTKTRAQASSLRSLVGSSSSCNRESKITCSSPLSCSIFIPIIRITLPLSSALNPPNMSSYISTHSFTAC
jgi:hypothetical protein